MEGMSSQTDGHRSCASTNECQTSTLKGKINCGTSSKEATDKKKMYSGTSIQGSTKVNKGKIGQTQEMRPHQHPSQSKPKCPTSNSRGTSSKMAPPATQKGTSPKMALQDETHNDTSNKRVTNESKDNEEVGHVRSRQEMGLSHSSQSTMANPSSNLAFTIPVKARKYYYSYVNEGKSPEEAVALCNEIIESQRSTKRNNDHITPPMNNKKNKKMRNRSQSPPRYDSQGTERGPKSTYASVTGITKVAILPEEFPRVVLPQESLGIIEKLLNKLMYAEDAEEEEDSVVFDGIHFSNSMLIFDVMNKVTVDWLKKFTSNPVGWEGPNLTVKIGDDIPPLYKFKAYFPKSRDMTQADLLRLIKRNNRYLNTHLWRFIKNDMKILGQTATVAIDKDSYKQLKERGGIIRYKFKVLKLRGFDKDDKENDDSEMDVDAIEKEHTPAVVGNTINADEEELLKGDEEEDGDTDEEMKVSQE